MGGNNADEFKTIILVANDYQIVNIYSVFVTEETMPRVRDKTMSKMLKASGLSKLEHQQRK